MATESLNVALIIDSLNVPEWQYQLVQHIVTARRIHLRLVILNPAQSEPQPQDTIQDSGPTEQKIRQRIKNTANHIIKHKLPHHGLSFLNTMDRLGQAPAFDPLQIRSLTKLCQPGIVYAVTDKQLLTQFAAHNIDVLLNPNQHDQLPAWLIRASRYGSCHLFFGATTENFTPWTGLREYTAGDDQFYSGITLSQTIPQPSEQYLLLTSSSINPACLQRSLVAMLCKMVAILPRLLQQLRDSDNPSALLAEKDQRYRRRIEAMGLQNQHGEHRELSSTAKYKLLYTAAKQVLQHKLNTLHRKTLARQTWTLLYGEHISPNDLSELKHYSPPPDKFWADPQLIIHKQRRFIFFEEWVDAQQKGRIVCAEWHGDDDFSAVVPVLEESWHLSYPHLFRYQGQYYMVPESADNKTISLYRCLRFPDRWEFVHHLMEGVEAFDATLHKHGARWWMFVSIRHHPHSPSDDLLYLYSADSPLSQHWLSHPANPIISEVSTARPAGKIIRIGDNLYRPSQNCAASYGRGLNLNRILSWNETTYQECNTGHYVPDGAAGLYGIHTFSMLDNCILSDGIVSKPFRKPTLWQWQNNKE